jgi:RecG-like helicase
VVTIVDDLQSPKIKPKKVKFIKLSKPIEDIYEAVPEIERKSPTQLPILLKLIELRERDVEAVKFIKEFGYSQSSLETLIKKGYITAELREVVQTYKHYYAEELPDFELTDDQKGVVKEIREGIKTGEFKTYLLQV